VLIVDDDPVSAGIAGAALEAAGFSAVPVHDPTRALALAIAEEVEAVVLDVLMPRMSGLDLLHRLRDEPRTRDLPVLMLSARGTAGDRVQGLQEGADDYLVKPFDPLELALRVGRLLQSSSARQSLAGRLETFSLGELLQSLQMGRKSGFLVVHGPADVGRLVLARGAVRSASFGSLTGRDAMLALLELGTGHFELEAREVAAAVPSAWAAQDLDVNDLLLEAAWLTDELAAHSAHLPPESALLTLTRGGGMLAPGLPTLPFTEALTALGTGRSRTLGDLLWAVPAAPSRVRLTVAILCESGVLAFSPAARVGA
jgi:CheY-like chemotaxis protein